VTFKPGYTGGGRTKGARNRLSSDFLENLAADFAKHGLGVIQTARIERPIEYLKIVANCLPRELEINDSRLKDLTDAEIDALIAQLKQQLSEAPITGDIERGKDEALH
jgi:hypothetical protein